MVKKSELLGLHVLLPDGSVDIYADVIRNEESGGLWPNLQHRWYVDEGVLHVVETTTRSSEGFDANDAPSYTLIATVAAAYGPGCWQRVQSRWAPSPPSGTQVSAYLETRRYPD